MQRKSKQIENYGKNCIRYLGLGAAKIVLTAEEVARLEQLADATGIDTRGGWEHSME